MGSTKPKIVSISSLHKRKCKLLQAQEEKIKILHLTRATLLELKKKISELSAEKNNLQKTIEERSAFRDKEFKELSDELAELEETFEKLERELYSTGDKYSEASNVEKILMEVGIRVQPEPGLVRFFLKKKGYDKSWMDIPVVWLSKKSISKGEPYKTLDKAFENWLNLKSLKAELEQKIDEQKIAIKAFIKKSEKRIREIDKEIKKHKRALQKISRELSEIEKKYQTVNTFEELAEEVKLSNSLLTILKSRMDLLRQIKREVKKIEKRIWERQASKNKELIGCKLWENWSKAFIAQFITSKKIMEPIMFEIFSEDETETNSTFNLLEFIGLKESRGEKLLEKLWEWLDELVEITSEGEIIYKFLDNGFFNLPREIKKGVAVLKTYFESVLTPSSSGENPFIAIKDLLKKEQLNAVGEALQGFGELMEFSFEEHQKFPKIYSQEKALDTHLERVSNHLENLKNVDSEAGIKGQLQQMISEVENCDLNNFKREFLSPLMISIEEIELSIMSLKESNKKLAFYLKAVLRWQRKLEKARQREKEKRRKKEEEQEGFAEVATKEKPIRETKQRKPLISTVKPPPSFSSMSKEYEPRGKAPESCPRCGGKIIEASITFNDFLGVEIADVLCENGHKEIIYLD